MQKVSERKSTNYYTSLGTKNRKNYYTRENYLNNNNKKTKTKNIGETIFINYGKQSKLKARNGVKSKESLEVLIEKKRYEATLEAAERLFVPNLLWKLVPQ